MTDKHRRFLGPVVEMRKLHDSAEQRIVHSAEMLDRKSLASVGDTTGERLTALLTETKAHTPEELAANVARIGELLGRFALYVPARFTDDPAEQAKYWAVRSGIFPAVGGSRPAGTTCLSEDVAFHIEDLPRATAELQALIARHGYDACIYGHALEDISLLCCCLCICLCHCQGYTGNRCCRHVAHNVQICCRCSLYSGRSAGKDQGCYD